MSKSSQEDFTNYFRLDSGKAKQSTGALKVYVHCSNNSTVLHSQIFMC